MRDYLEGRPGIAAASVTIAIVLSAPGRHSRAKDDRVAIWNVARGLLSASSVFVVERDGAALKKASVVDMLMFSNWLLPPLLRNFA